MLVGAWSCSACRISISRVAPPPLISHACRVWGWEWGCHYESWPRRSAWKPAHFHPGSDLRRRSNGCKRRPILRCGPGAWIADWRDPRAETPPAGAARLLLGQQLGDRFYAKSCNRRSGGLVALSSILAKTPTTWFVRHQNMICQAHGGEMDCSLPPRYAGHCNGPSTYANKDPPENHVTAGLTQALCWSSKATTGDNHHLGVLAV